MATPPNRPHPQKARLLVVIIPAYNEADTIEAVIASLPAQSDYADAIRAIVVDDGSTDQTAELAAEAGACVVSHGRNFGLATAFRTGIRTALEHRADIAVTMDADQQFTPDDLPNLIEPILLGRADFVAGDRFPDTDRPDNMSVVKFYGNRLMTAVVSRLTGRRFNDVSSGYRAYSREALLNLNVQSSFTYTQESFLELSAKELRIEQCPVRVRYDKERRSVISGNLLKYTTKTLLTIGRATRDYAPFAVFGTIAAILTVPGVALAIFVLGHYLSTGSFSPYIFLAFSAVYLCTLGFGLLVLALHADMMRGIRSNQENILYLQKKAIYTPAPQRSDN